MAEVRRLGDIASPMIAKLLAQRRRLSLVYQRDEDMLVILPTFGLMFWAHRVELLVSWGQWQAGIAWRRFL